MHGSRPPPSGVSMELLANDRKSLGVSSFDQFYQEERTQQVRRAFLLLGCADAAHDVVAESFTQVLRRWSDISEPGPYLNRCVLNGCRSAGRMRTERGTSPLETAPPEVTASSEETVEFAHLLIELPFKQRAAIVCRYYGGLTENEIAKLLECRPGTVGPLIYRGLNKLREDLT